MTANIASDTRKEKPVGWSAGPLERWVGRHSVIGLAHQADAKFLDRTACRGHETRALENSPIALSRVTA